MARGHPLETTTNCSKPCAASPSMVYSSSHIHVVLRRSPARITSPSPSPRCRADETLPQHSAGSEFEGRHRAERVQNSEVPYVRYLIGWIAKTFDYINRVNLMLPLSVYEGTWTHFPPSPFLLQQGKRGTPPGAPLGAGRTPPWILYIRRQGGTLEHASSW